LVAVLAVSGVASAHVGSPNVFFQGHAGPYPIRVTIRPPAAIPGIASIAVRVASNVEGVRVRPFRWDAGPGGAPPPDEALPVGGDPGLRSAEQWLMTPGSYYYEVAVRGAGGLGTVRVPVSVAPMTATKFPLPLLLAMGAMALFLAAGAIVLAYAAARDATLGPGEMPGARRRAHGRWAALAATAALGAAFCAEGRWWAREDSKFNQGLFKPYRTTARVKQAAETRSLELSIVDERWMVAGWTPLFPDHGKIMHAFVVRQPGLDAIAHLHPRNSDLRTFDATLPPLPAGRYRVYADITQESGFSQTLTATVDLPAPPLSPWDEATRTDPDDSWLAGARPPEGGAGATARLTGGRSLRWILREPLRSDADCILEFEARDAAGQPVPLESYMGMLGHAAIVGDEGRVFVHLHPVGSVSMAAQSAFEDRIGQATPADEAHAQHHAQATPPGTISFPFAFPAPGSYRLFVQIKVDGSVSTAVFDAHVGPSV
jgi:hypothetical protein